MEHFYEQIPGWFDYQDIFRRMVGEAPEGAHFVEVGIHLGRSAAFMAVEIARSGKHIQYDCIDPWDGRTAPGRGGYGNSREIFLANMSPVEGHFTAIVGLSPDIAVKYADDSLWFVFLDGEHSYDCVEREIHAWLPKIRSGGYLGGHDYEAGAELPNGLRGPPLGNAVKALLPQHETHKGRLATSWLYQKP